MELKKTLLVALTRNNGSDVRLIDKNGRLICDVKYEDTSCQFFTDISDEEGSHIDCHCFRAVKRFREKIKEELEAK